jgi:hypothetical protein
MIKTTFGRVWAVAVEQIAQQINNELKKRVFMVRRPKGVQRASKHQEPKKQEPR